MSGFGISAITRYHDRRIDDLDRRTGLTDPTDPVVPASPLIYSEVVAFSSQFPTVGVVSAPYVTAQGGRLVSVLLVATVAGSTNTSVQVLKNGVGVGLSSLTLFSGETGPVSLDIPEPIPSAVDSDVWTVNATGVGDGVQGLTVRLGFR